MPLKKNLQYKAFLSVFSIWIVSLVAVYLPISRLLTPTFPLTIEYNYKLLLFVVSATISSIIAFYIGFDRLKGGFRKISLE